MNERRKNLRRRLQSEMQERSSVCRGTLVMGVLGIVRYVVGRVSVVPLPLVRRIFLAHGVLMVLLAVMWLEHDTGHTVGMCSLSSALKRLGLGGRCLSSLLVLWRGGMFQSGTQTCVRGELHDCEAIRLGIRSMGGVLVVCISLLAGVFHVRAVMCRHSHNTLRRSRTPPL